MAQQRLARVLRDMVDRQPVPIYAVTASARQRLPKIRACIDYWAECIAAAALTADRGPSASPLAHRASQ